MAEIKQMTNDKVKPTVGMYDRPSTSAVVDDTREDAIAVERPRDLVRWGPVIAGLFAALATLATLTVLGLAIGLSSYNAGDPASSFGIGAGIWGAISALIAFGVGGWLAGRTAATRGTSSGILNGAMVWFVAVPLLVYLLGSGIGALARTAGNVAGTAVQTAGSAAGAAAGQAADNPAAQATAQAGAANIGTAAQATAQAIGDQVTPQRVEEAANTAGTAAWGTLLSLGLAAAAAIAGGYLGARRQPTTVVRAAT
jgi:hypothetical protein